MDIKPILGYDELRYMLVVGHEYVPEKRFLDTADNKSISWFGELRFMWYSINRKWNFDGSLKFALLDRAKANPKDCFLVYGVRDIGKAKELLLYLVSHDAKCAYIVNEDPPSWFRLSPYMDLLIE